MSTHPRVPLKKFDSSFFSPQSDVGREESLNVSSRQRASANQSKFAPFCSWFGSTPHIYARYLFPEFMVQAMHSEGYSTEEIREVRTLSSPLFSCSFSCLSHFFSRSLLLLSLISGQISCLFQFSIFSHCETALTSHVVLLTDEKMRSVEAICHEYQIQECSRGAP